MYPRNYPRLNRHLILVRQNQTCYDQTILILTDVNFAEGERILLRALKAGLRSSQGGAPPLSNALQQ